VTLLSAWALAGLLLIAPLVLAHLRRRRPPPQEVPSLLIWEQLQKLPTSGERRLRIPRLPVLLALQMLAVAVLVLALARPAGGARAGSEATRVLVLDDSLWMTPTGRLSTAERGLLDGAASTPSAKKVAVVVSGSTPYVLYQGGRAGVAAALARVRPTTAPNHLDEAMRLAGALLERGGRIVVMRAPEDALPPLPGSLGEIQEETAGTASGLQAILSPSARCDGSGVGECELLASIRNTAPRAVLDKYLIEGVGTAPLERSVRVPAGGQVEVALPIKGGSRVALRLLGPNILAAASRVTGMAPSGNGLSSSTSVTIVGAPADALPVARALSAVSGVKLRLRTPSDYRPADARASTVAVFDRSLPSGALPPTPGVLLIDPPRLPGGRVGAVMREAELSGTDPSSPLLAGVDLSSLTVSDGGARVMTLPGALQWVAWSAEGPLLAFGRYEGRRLALLSFDPAMSDLPQLSAFPVLLANLLRSLAAETQPRAMPLPGSHGPPSPVAMATPAGSTAGGPPKNLAPWLLIAAVLVMALEAAYAARQPSRVVPA
jgi:Aerotolerance regulator N-terminal